MAYPERVVALARDFSEAGARIVTTNTFGGNRIRLAAFGLENEVESINRRAVALVREGANTDTLVAASLGPTGCKDIVAKAREIRDAYGEQARFLASAGADVLLLETMTSPEEARIALGGYRCGDPA